MARSKNTHHDDAGHNKSGHGSKKPSHHNHSQHHQACRFSASDNAFNNKPSDWGKPSDEAIELARQGKVVYREQKFIGTLSIGTLTFKGLDNKIYNVREFTGGLGAGAQPGVSNGTNARDPRHGNVFIPEYTISAPTWSKHLGVPVLPISEPPKATGRENMPEHRDVAQPGGSFGCPNHHPDDERIISGKLAPLLKKHGSHPYVMLPSLDRNNPYATHFHASEKRVAEEHTRELAKTLASAKVSMGEESHPNKPDARATGKRNPTIARN